LPINSASVASLPRARVGRLLLSIKDELLSLEARKVEFAP
jgi:hypothetical protein